MPYIRKGHRPAGVQYEQFSKYTVTSTICTWLKVGFGSGLWALGCSTARYRTVTAAVCRPARHTYPAVAGGRRRPAAVRRTGRSAAAGLRPPPDARRTPGPPGGEVPPRRRRRRPDPAAQTPSVRADSQCRQLTRSLKQTLMFTHKEAPLVGMRSMNYEHIPNPGMNDSSDLSETRVPCHQHGTRLYANYSEQPPIHNNSPNPEHEQTTVSAQPVVYLRFLSAIGFRPIFGL